MSVRMRVTRSHTGNRRSHHGLKGVRLSACGKCGEKHLRHHMCENCGTYRDKEIVDVVAQEARRQKRLQNKARELGQDVQKDEPNESSDKVSSGKEKEEKNSAKELNVAELSKK